MYRQLVTSCPCVLNDGGQAYIIDLLHHIELAQPVLPFCKVGDAVQLGLVSDVNILDMPKPVVDQPKLPVAACGDHPAAAVMPADDDVFNFQHLDRVLQNRQAVHVRMNDHVGDVAVNENLSWRQTQNLVGRDTTVRAAYPKVLRCLLGCQPHKLVWI